MSEATNKTADAKRKSAATAAKTVAKGATEQATETKPDATVKADETKPTESTPETPSTGEADKLEQSDAEKADSKTEGDKDEGERSEGSAGIGGDVGAAYAGLDGSGPAFVAGGNSDFPGVGASDNQTARRMDGSLDGIKGAFVVTAKTDVGFWRSGIKFKRLEKTLVLVLDEDEGGIDDLEIVGYESSQVVCLSVEKAKRVHSEKNLVVTEIDLDELKVK
ncbi:MAG: hypothetical protein ACTH5B_15805 [Marinomonas sp.]|uniref:hypothetical protein n=1 Tax=Marinomonas sp. TaxID=1904862 RepID=UPI003F94C5D3